MADFIPLTMISSLIILESPVTREEVCTAITELKSSKNAGPDHIIAECLRFSWDILVNFIQLLFNILFDRSYIPKSWCMDLIEPLYKQGDTSVANNYRGISITNIFLASCTFTF